MRIGRKWGMKQLQRRKQVLRMPCSDLKPLVAFACSRVRKTDLEQLCIWPKSATLRQLKILSRARRPSKVYMRAPLLTVASGEIPRRRTFIRLVSMGSKLAKLQGSDRSSQEDCVFCDIVKGVGRGKIFEVRIIPCWLRPRKTDVVNPLTMIVTSGALHLALLMRAEVMTLGLHKFWMTSDR